MHTVLRPQFMSTKYSLKIQTTRVINTFKWSYGTHILQQMSFRHFNHTSKTEKMDNSTQTKLRVTYCCSWWSVLASWTVRTGQTLQNRTCSWPGANVALCLNDFPSINKRKRECACGIRDLHPHQGGQAVPGFLRPQVYLLYLSAPAIKREFEFHFKNTICASTLCLHVINCI